jgi:hypothetical protein
MAKYKPATKPAVFEDRVMLLPYVVAETVLGARGMDPYSPEGQWFIAYVDGYVRWLHANKPDWKKKLEKSRDPRPFVYGFVRHWLDAYEQNPRRFKTQAASVGLGCAPRTFHGFAAGEETVDSIYLGNFGDASPLDYNGFFVWWRPNSSTRQKGKKHVRRLAKGRTFKSGDLFAIKVTNWCDASGECENEERVLAEEAHVDVADLLSKDGWIEWDRVADSVGTDVTDLLKDPVWAWEAAIGYYGAHEFHGGGYNPLYTPGGSFVESFDRMARDLLNLGVPESEVGDYLGG